MAARDALIAVWSTGRPAGASGATFVSGDTRATKLAAINGWTVAQGFSNKALVDPSDILNAIVPVDLAGLTQLQTLQLTLLLSGASVDASTGTTIRAGIKNLFAGKTQTLANLDALVSAADSPTITWWLSVGFTSPVGTADTTLAGLS